jgi:hypothetical protein
LKGHPRVRAVERRLALVAQCTWRDGARVLRATVDDSARVRSVEFRLVPWRAVLPADLRECEKRGHLHEVVALDTRPQQCMAYARYLGWDQVLFPSRREPGHASGACARSPGVAHHHARPWQGCAPKEGTRRA